MEARNFIKSLLPDQTGWHLAGSPAVSCLLFSVSHNKPPPADRQLQSSALIVSLIKAAAVSRAQRSASTIAASDGFSITVWADMVC